MSEFLTFTLGAERYGVDILQVREIRRYENVTPLAGSADFLKGVMDLRGAIVPIVDLRMRLKLERAAYDALTALIILSIGDRLVGMVVDSVSDVAAFAPQDIKPVPELGGAAAGRYITGLASTDGGMVLLLDLARVVSSEALEHLPQAEPA